MRLPHASFLLAAATLAAACSANAATLNWDGATTSGSTFSLGGTGTWTTATTNWDTGSAFTSWTDTTGTDTAVFGGVAGTVTLGSAETANALNFTTTGYRLAGSTLTLAGATPSITTGSGVTATIASAVVGTANLTKTGTGTLVLAGTNTYTGNTTVNAGTLEIDGGIYAPLSTQTITVAGGATLKISNAANNPLGHGQGQSWIITGTFTEATAGVQILAGNVILNGGTLTSTAGNATYGSFVVYNGNDTITANGAGNTISAVNFGINSGLTLTLATTLGTDTLLASTVFKDGSSTGGAVTKTGLGTVTYTGANTYTGATTITGGTLDLGGGTATGSISAGSALVLGGGTLSYTRTGNTTQTFAGTTINAGASAVTAVAGDTVNLGAITARNGGGTIDFGATGGVKATTGTANTILTAANGAAYATVGGSDWAAKDATNTSVVGLSTVGGYTNFTAGTVALTGNADLTGAAGTYSLGASASPTTIRNLVSGNTIDLGGFTLATGGVLSNSNQTISDGIGTGSLTAASAGGDLVFIQTANTATVGAVIADNTSASSLTKSGAGTLTLSGANTYTGKTYLNGGVLNIVADNNLGAAPGSAVADQLTVNGGTLQSGAGITLAANRGVTLNGVGGTFDTNGFNSSVSGVIAGPGGLTKIGTGTLTLNAVNTYTGNTTIGGGTLTLSQSATLSNTAQITINAGGTLNLAASGTAGANRDKLQAGNTTTSALVINGTLANNGNSETRLYAATITMNNGTIACNGGEALYGSFAISNGTGRTITANGASNFINGSGNGIGLDAGNTLTFNTPTLADGLVVSVALGGSTGGFTGGSVVKSGAGAVTFSGANTYTGGLIVSGGVLNYTGGGSVTGAGGAINIATGATLNLGGTANNQLEATGVITVAGTLAATNAGVANTFRGASIILNGGTIASTVANTSAYGAFLVNSAVTINANGTGNTISGTSVIGIASGKVLTLNTTLGGDTLAVTGTLGQGGSGTAGGVTKTGLGVVTFSGANTYTGGTTVSAGTLVAGGAGALGGGAVTVASGAKLQVGAAGVALGANASLAINGTLVVGSTGINGGAGTAVATLSGTGKYTFNGILDLNGLFDNAAAGQYTLISAGVGNTDTAVAFANYSGADTLSFSNGILTLNAVPEPSTYGLIGAGALAAVAFVRRRRKVA